MSTDTREQFFQNLSDSGLFTPQEVNSTRESLLKVHASDGDAVVRELVANGKLTQFQAEAVRERRFDGLRIGNYDVLDRIGQGGMGTVFKARHKRMRRVVAIKVLSRNVAQADRFIKRFQREVEAVARLNHPNIVMAHDADEDAVGHYLVMEFVNGRDLASTVQERGPLPVREALACIVQAAWALEYAHGQGIIHRDIKPANLLRDVSGVVKVADLGLARFDDAVGPPPEDASALTQAGAIMGTVDYMSPEQALGAPTIDHRTDIYSLGCTLFFLATGEPPFKGPSLMATLLMHRDAPIPSMHALRPEIPGELDAILQRMMAKSAGDRYKSMTEVVHALESLEEKLREYSEEAIVLEDPDSTSPAGQSREWASQNTVVGVPSQAVQQTVDFPPPADAPKPPLLVLLVEPSRTQSAIIRKYLQSNAVQQVTTVATAKEAIEHIRRERPRVVLAALHLADMGGVQLAEQIHKETAPTPPGFVLISSEAESAEAKTLSKCGNALYLKKPFTAEQLIDALKLVSGERALPPVEPAFSTLRVLIVDDSAAARLHIKGVLGKLGLARIVEATDGAHAVVVLTGQTFDLIVTDYNMPHMDGRGLVGYLKQTPALAAVPVIMVTTENEPGKLEAVRRLGVAAICGKNFPPDVVRQVLEKLVQSR